MKARDDWPREASEEQRLRDAVWRAMPSWTAFTIGIDGRDGTGKSTLARYLAWQLGMPAVELDLYLTGSGEICHRYDELQRTLRARLDRDRPIIIEGIGLLAAMDEVAISCDFLVVVEAGEWKGAESFQAKYEAYEAAHDPYARSAHVYRRS